ncbi:hypothetical protein ABZ631_02540 [Nocardiopsis alba]|uniref:hypothetical protein n=1 Tax=Nocardiopsis alba TaxID=53437 RepID=UPI0033B3502C
MTVMSMSGNLRSVLNAPRGHRFNRPKHDVPSPTDEPGLSEDRARRERVMLSQMRGNPRVEHRLRYGELPDWMTAPVRSGPARAYTSCSTPPRRRPAGHRKPRRMGWKPAGYALAMIVGLLLGHLTPWTFPS